MNDIISNTIKNSLIQFDDEPDFQKSSNDSISYNARQKLIEFQLKNDVTLNANLYVDKHGKYIIANIPHKPQNYPQWVGHCVAPASASPTGYPLFAMKAVKVIGGICTDERFNEVRDELTDDDGWYNTSLLYDGNIENTPLSIHKNVCNDQYIPSINELKAALTFDKTHKAFTDKKPCFSSSKYDNENFKYIYYLGGIGGLNPTTFINAAVIPFIHVDPQNISEII